MKTLDEVIKGFECCQEINCAECPYENGDNTDVVHCNDTDKEDDALHYLREYQAEKANLEIIKGNYQDAIANCEKAENKFKTALKKLDIGTLNDPLTWNELRKMVGKPVWVENVFGLAEWELVANVKEDSVYTIAADEVGADIPKEDYPHRWQAYRKERS